MKQKTPHENQKNGFTLVEVLVASALMLIMGLAFVTMQTNMMKENRALEEKVGSIEFSRYLTTAFSSLPVCTAMVSTANFQNSSATPFDSSTLTTAPYEISLNTIPGTIPGSTLVNAGDPASAATPSLVLASATASPPGIRLRIESVSPPQVSLLIHFNETNLVRPLKDLEFKLPNVVLTGPASSVTISGCVGSVPVPGSVVAGCSCRPQYASGTSCQIGFPGDPGFVNNWACWGGADVSNPPAMTCPVGTDLRVTGQSVGGPTGFICLQI